MELFPQLFNEKLCEQLLVGITSLKWFSDEKSLLIFLHDLKDILVISNCKVLSHNSLK